MLCSAVTDVCDWLVQLLSGLPLSAHVLALHRLHAFGPSGRLARCETRGLLLSKSGRHLGSCLQDPPPMTRSPGHQEVSAEPCAGGEAPCPWTGASEGMSLLPDIRPAELFFLCTPEPPEAHNWSSEVRISEAFTWRCFKDRLSLGKL